MKRLQLTIQALTLVALMSTATFAGNIGGMRSEPAESSSKTATGNIGGLKSEELSLSVAIAGNIGGCLSMILGGTVLP